MIDAVLKIITEAVKNKFTGSITLNFYQGNIATVKREECFKI